MPIIAHPEWKFHHGTVMYLHRPDKLAEVAAGLQQLKADREKARTEAPSSPRSPGRQRAPTSAPGNQRKNGKRISERRKGTLRPV